VEGGLLEVDPDPVAAGTRLLLRHPDLGTATAIAEAVNAAAAGTARVVDPGVVALTPSGPRAADLPRFLSAIDQLTLTPPSPAGMVIDSRDGTVVAGSEVHVGAAVVSHRGITLEIGAPALPASTGPTDLVRLAARASVADVAAGLHAAGARAEDI